MNKKAISPLSALEQLDLNTFSRISFPVSNALQKLPIEKTLHQYSSSSCKNQEKANNSPSYRCAAINKRKINKYEPDIHAFTHQVQFK